ncbi:MAG: hypothetical protein IPK17_14975 [Chloroflexi bacterium]|nr:hypothetical protein [Chloroflexota bacterium]
MQDVAAEANVSLASVSYISTISPASVIQHANALPRQ